MVIRRGTPLALVVVAFLTAPVRGDDFPKELVRWKSIAENPVFAGTGKDTWDRKIRERGYILVENGVYRLWYTGYNDDRSPTKFLGLASSPDGIHWTRDTANPVFTKSWTEDVCVIRHNDQYVMFAEGKDDIAHQMTSPDGRRWNDEGPIDIRKRNGDPLSPGPYGTPTIWFENDVWYLFYERGDLGIWLATSRDRKIFTNVQDEPVISRGPETYDQAAVAMNQVIKRKGVYYAFYHANSHRPWKDWTTCIARSYDLIHWEKYAGNPIIQNNCSSALLVSGSQGDRLYTMHPEVRVFESADKTP